MTKIIRCECKHEYQDAKYGKNRRVGNKTAKGPANNPSYRCTVCGTERAPI